MTFNLCNHKLNFSIFSLELSELALLQSCAPQLLSLDKKSCSNLRGVKSSQSPLQLFPAKPQHTFWVHRACLTASPSISPPDGDKLTPKPLLFSCVSIRNVLRSDETTIRSLLSSSASLCLNMVFLWTVYGRSFHTLADIAVIANVSKMSPNGRPSFKLRFYMFQICNM